MALGRWRILILGSWLTRAPSLSRKKKAKSAADVVAIGNAVSRPFAPPPRHPSPASCRVSVKGGEIRILGRAAAQGRAEGGSWGGR